MIMIKNTLIICALVLTAGTTVWAQNATVGGSKSSLDGRDVRTVTSAVPLMRISPNARSGAMGETGVATTPDANSIHWNAAKFAFMEKDLGVSVSYTPWLRQLVNDIYLAYLSGYYKLDDNQAIAASLRYFSLGTIQFTNENNESQGQGTPNELAVDAAYSVKLNSNLSAALSARYIRSDLASGQNVNGIAIKAGNAFATDLSVYYNKETKIGDYNANYALGANFSNIGSKVSYSNTNDRDFLPMNMGLGSYLNLQIDEYNEIAFAFDINKLLVPSPDSNGVDSDNDGILDYKQKTVPEAFFSSFGDAPDGFSEELREYILSFGMEYWYDKQFAARAGYFHEHALKGNRKYFTFGLGLRFNIFGIDVSYLVPTNSQQNPLNNTLRFTLLFDLEAFSDSESSAAN